MSEPTKEVSVEHLLSTLAVLVAQIQREVMNIGNGQGALNTRVQNLETWVRSKIVADNEKMKEAPPKESCELKESCPITPPTPN